MGLFRKTESEKLQDARRKADRIKTDQEVYEAKQEGYRKGSLERAKAEGYAKGKGGGGRGGGVVNAFNAIGGSIRNTEKAFGFDSGFGGGLDFGFGGNQKPAWQPQRVTRVTKSGTVIITEPATSNIKKQKQKSPYDWMDDMPNFLE